MTCQPRLKGWWGEEEVIHFKEEHEEEVKNRLCQGPAREDWKRKRQKQIDFLTIRGINFSCLSLRLL
jgi:hypothetical protein